MTERLTKKEKTFVKEYVKTGNGTQSALKAYDTDSENVAANIACTNLMKPKIENAIMSIAEQIPDSLLLEVHLDGLQAVDDKGNEDYATRHRYLDTSYKLKGSYAAEKKQVEITGKISAITEEQRLIAKEYEERLKEKI